MPLEPWAFSSSPAAAPIPATAARRSITTRSSSAPVSALPTSFFRRQSSAQVGASCTRTETASPAAPSLRTAPAFSASRHRRRRLRPTELHSTLWTRLIPLILPPAGVASGPNYALGFSTISPYTGSPQSVVYGDPYYGGRAPQYIDYNFGIQQQVAQKPRSEHLLCRIAGPL